MAFAMLSPVVFSRLTKSKNAALILGETSTSLESRDDHVLLNLRTPVAVGTGN